MNIAHRGPTWRDFIVVLGALLLYFCWDWVPVRVILIVALLVYIVFEIRTRHRRPPYGTE